MNLNYPGIFLCPLDSMYLFSQEAKNAFKELLESVHIEADCTWEQVIFLTNDITTCRFCN